MPSDTSARRGDHLYRIMVAPARVMDGADFHDPGKQLYELETNPQGKLPFSLNDFSDPNISLLL